MFKQAAALWKRLVAPSPAFDARATTGPDERRVWVRYPARLETQVKPAGAEETCVNGKVLDVSRGGMKLLVIIRFEEGSLISIDLPADDGRSEGSVLACVVRSEQQPTGEWVLGCNFSAELDAFDLQRFGVLKAKPGQPDQRGWSRFGCNVRAQYTETTAEVTVKCAARVGNISVGGVSLLVDRDVPNGTMLSVDLLTADGDRVTTILACVVHVNVLPDGGRALGCNFICELSEEQLNTLLFQPGAAV